jgi:flagellar biosynthesis chaperone FliJ
MPKSSNHLEALLRLRKSEMEAELSRLYRRVRDLHAQQERIRQSEVEHHAVIHSIRESDQAGDDIEQLLVHRKYLTRLREEAKKNADLANQLAEAANEVRSQVEVSVNRFRIVEKLRNRRREECLDRIAKMNERIVDDETTTRFAKQIQSENEDMRVAST